MAVVVKRDQRRKWVVVRATGELTLAEILNLIQTARADIEYRMWPMLFDPRSATTAVTEQEIGQAVEAVRHATQKQGPRGAVAIVADDDQLYDRTLLYETRCAEIGVRLIRVFRQADDAMRWLEIMSAAQHFG